MRIVMPISMSPLNPDAQIVAQALKDVPPGGRSAAILRWAAAYLNGQTNSQPVVIPEIGMTEDEFDALLDDF